MYIAKTMNSTTPIPSLMAGAAKLAKELAGRKAEANAGAAMPISRAAPDALDVSSFKQFFLWWLEYMYFLRILVPGEVKYIFFI